MAVPAPLLRLLPQVCCAACLFCAQPPPGAGISAEAAWQCANNACETITRELAEAYTAAERTGELSLAATRYKALLAKEQTLLQERAGLGLRLTAGWSCADALVRPPACAPTCPCAHLPLRPPAQPCVAAL